METIHDRGAAYFHLNCIRTLDGARTILLRGGSRPLHLHIGPHIRSHIIELLKGNMDRLTCISLDYATSGALKWPLPNLTKLVFVGQYGITRHSATLLDGTKFLNLQSLSMEMEYDWQPSWLPEAFPPITELALRTSDPSPVSMIVTRLARNLTVLCVDFPEVPLDSTRQQPSKITFPRLRSLSLINHAFYTISFWPFDAQTPILNSYGESSLALIGERNLHKDTRTVKEFIYDHSIDLRLFPQLFRITTDLGGAKSLLKALSLNPRGLPDLKETHCPPYISGAALIDGFNLKYGRNVKFMSSLNWDLNKDIHFFSLPSVCTWTLPRACLMKPQYGLGIECNGPRNPPRREGIGYITQ